jgi:predicted RNase H-like HicB family nuclease
MPKAFFYGKTIEECFDDAEKAFGGVVESGWDDKISK